MSFKPSKVSIETDGSESFYKIRYRDGGKSTKIMFEIADAGIPFGVDFEYGQYYITVETDDIEYIHYIRKIEKGVCEVLNKRLIEDEVVAEPIEMSTSIRKARKGSYWIKTKITQYRDRFSITCLDVYGSHQSPLELTSGDIANFILYIDYAWIKDNCIHFKWKIHRVELIDP